MLESVSDYDQLPVNCHGVLPNGLQVWKWIDRDYYAGTKRALIAAGIAQADWFARAAPPGKRRGGAGTAFTIEAAAGPVELIAHANRKWEVRIPVSAAERGRREAALQPQIEAAQDALLAESITLAPPVAPGSLSAAELRHIRLLRTMGPRSRGGILDFTESVLLADARYGELAQRQAPRLVLAVDNTRAGQ